ncbi:hypothetical protein B0H16DRAFT_1471574 [Mycena metata]|uniref:Uncharacterized protein n=1 Tax=Mycena metata TaxID=1033252 RepID=A0AAD7HQC0_9AGAR|nr:hypothetical protein B0H16DRAFT_1478238 [Mycena metata]KAJ7725906.1 hypothetical protein B0H16DRAFT_1471574 [Mycena metata]
MESLSPFDPVSKNLLALGALSIDDFLSAPYEPDVSRLSSIPLPIIAASSTPKPANKSTEPARIPTQDTNSANLARLHATCLRQRQLSGETSNLKFDILEESASTKQCILTITRPDSATRSYKTEPVFRRKTDAKAQAATIAIECGAIDFILRGDSDELKARKGVLLASLSDSQPVASTSKLPFSASAEMLRVQEIEACCREWRGPFLKPYWHDFDDGSKLDTKKISNRWKKHGTVLKIQLTPHCFRVYSCEAIFDSPDEAREHCATAAIDEGVLEFIRHGNGQMAPQANPTLVPDRQFKLQTLQTFYESLPRPLEEDFDQKTAAEINASGTFATLLATSTGSHFVPEFYHLETINEITLVHGYVLRLRRPGECRSYLVEPRFGTTKIAKAAVTLLALSLGAGRWIREVTETVKARIPPQMRQFVLTTVTPALAAETRRIGGKGSAPRFEFYNDGQAVGCKLQVNLKPNGEDPREYVVPAEYNSRADAKVAVAYLAAQQGVIDLLRGGGQPGPSLSTPAVTSPHVPPVAPHSMPPVAPHLSTIGTGKRRKKRKKDAGEPEGLPAKRLRTVPVAGPSVHGGGLPGFATLPPTLVDTSSDQFREEVYGVTRHSTQHFPQWQLEAAAARNNPGGSASARRSPSLEDGELEEEEVLPPPRRK